jgi:hypothetical protein
MPYSGGGDQCGRFPAHLYDKTRASAWLLDMSHYDCARPALRLASQLDHTRCQAKCCIATLSE